MLTVGYCRVSTEKQATEGYSIEGQTDKLRAYSSLRDLGDVTIITDPGLSGKDLSRPGLQQLLAAVEAGHVSHVIVWNLSRLSRNLADLILLADTFGRNDVALHSVSENLDLSTAAGRMFYNVLGTFAQFFREQLIENVKMGNDRAIAEGRWINRPKTGYSLENGLLVPNRDAEMVREIFRLRSEGESYRAIEDKTGIKYSTVRAILDSRIYLGEIVHNGVWSHGVHEALVTAHEWEAAHRNAPKGVRRSKDVLSGRVFCGICLRRMVVAQNGKGTVLFRCWHRGSGCDLPSRETRGLSRAAVLGLRLIGTDEGLREAIRRRLAGRHADAGDAPRRGRRPTPAVALRRLDAERRKLLDLFYSDKISPDLFHEEESRIAREIEAVRQSLALASADEQAQSDLETRFEEVARMLADLDVEHLWAHATDAEKRTLVTNLIESVVIHPNVIEVKVVSTPPIRVLPTEVGLKGSENVRVEGGT